MKRIERVNEHINTLRPSALIYKGLPTSYRDGIKSLYQYFKDQRLMPVIPNLKLTKPGNAVEWYQQATKLQQSILWTDYVVKALYMEDYA